jgi:hypothetical protein
LTTSKFCDWPGSYDGGKFNRQPRHEEVNNTICENCRLVGNLVLHRPA